LIQIQLIINLVHTVVSLVLIQFLIILEHTVVTSTPPKIYKENIFIAYLTVNTFMFPRVDTNLLVVWLNE